MRQVWISRAGGPEVLEVREVPDPTPGPGEVRVRVAAAGINFADLMGRMGTYPDAPPIPFVPGYEVSGTIDAVGEGVDANRVGQRVAGLTRFGGYTDVLVLPSDGAVELPASVDLVTAAGVPTTALTAWMLLEVFGRVRKGDRVLVQNAGGGVGLMALDLILWRGATAIGTASKGKHARLLERGYSQLIDYRNEDFEAVLGERSVDLVLDPMGGESWAKGLRVLRSGGMLGCFGFSAANTGSKRSLLSTIHTAWQVPWLKINPLTLMSDNRGVYGVNLGHLWDEQDRVAGWLQELFALWEHGVLRPHVHATYSFDQAVEAHRAIHARENFGKVLLTP